MTKLMRTWNLHERIIFEVPWHIKYPLRKTEEAKTVIIIIKLDFDPCSTKPYYIPHGQNESKHSCSFRATATSESKWMCGLKPKNSIEIWNHMYASKLKAFLGFRMHVWCWLIFTMIFISSFEMVQRCNVFQFSLQLEIEIELGNESGNDSPK